MKNKYINGIVITEKVDESITIDADSFVFSPYAAGQIIVFNPIGVANAINVKVNISLLTLKLFNISSFTLYPPITKPASIMATGP